MNLLKGSFFLKLMALVVAVLTYFYIHNEIRSREEETTGDPSYKLIKLTAKSLPVKARLESTLPTGYHVLMDQIAVAPATVTVIGPEALFEDAQAAETSLIDVSEYTKTVTKRVPLESVSGIHVVGDPMEVTVTIPIEKIPGQEEEKPLEAAPADAAAAVPAPPAAA